MRPRIAWACALILGASPVALADGPGGGSNSCIAGVSLQSSSPGVADVGNWNVNGAGIAGGTVTASGLIANGAASLEPTAYATGSLPGTCTDGTITWDSTTHQLKVCLSNAWGVAGGVTSVAMTAPGEFTVGGSPITGAGTLALSYTATQTAGGVVYADGTKRLVSAAGSANNCLLSGGTGAPTWGSCSTGSGTVTTLSMPGEFTVTNPTTTPAVTYTATQTAGGVVYADGSKRLVTAAGSANQCLLSGGASAPTWGACSGVGGVTSVALAMPGEYTITNSPVTTSGTLTAAYTATQTAGGIVYADGSKRVVTAAGNAGQVLYSNGAGAPSFGNSAWDVVNNPRWWFYQPNTVGANAWIATGAPTITVIGTAQSTATLADQGGGARFAEDTQSSGSNNAPAGWWNNGGLVTRGSMGPRLLVNAQLPSTITLRRNWVGLAVTAMDAIVVAASAAQADAMVAIGWDTAVFANYQCCSGDATTLTCTDTGVAVATSQDVKLDVDWRTAGAATLTCNITTGAGAGSGWNAVVSTTKATNLPATTTNLQWEVVTTALTAAVVHAIQGHTIALEQN